MLIALVVQIYTRQLVHRSATVPAGRTAQGSHQQPLLAQLTSQYKPSQPNHWLSLSKTTPSTADGAGVHIHAARSATTTPPPQYHKVGQHACCPPSSLDMAGTPKPLNNPDRHEHTAGLTASLTRSLCQAKPTHVWVGTTAQCG